MKLKIRESNILLIEKLQKLGSDMFITDYIGNVVDLVKNKTDRYRILYDSKIDKYIIAKSYEHTHFDMLRTAYNNGYYIELQDYIDNVSGGLHNYFSDGIDGDSNDTERYIVCYAVYGDSATKWLYDDGYVAGYLLDTKEFRFPDKDRVVIGVKGTGFLDRQFYTAFGKPRILSRQELGFF